ncbi:MAG: branched-chain amino acid transporter [Bacillales bacterium]|jgi:branched-subunit amino acid transport protein|nr:branched-chain amino acid transporter [Bacillales bacterium]
MSDSVLLLIVGMSVVTLLPRLLPFFILSDKPLPPFWQNVLGNIPYAILGALVFPGSLKIHEDMWYGLIGILVAIVASWFVKNVIWVVVSSVAVLTIISVVW